MYYSEVINAFRLEYADQCSNRGVTPRNFTNAEIMYKLSKIQKELCEVHRLFDTYYQKTLTVGTNAYSLSSQYVFDIKHIQIDGATNTDSLTKSDIDEVKQSITNGTNSVPTLYNWDSVNETLTFDGTVTSGMKLNIWFWKKFWVFIPDPAGTRRNYSFLDYDETKTGYGGSFSIPNEYISLMIDGAIASIFPDMINSYMIKLNQAIINRPTSINFGLKYYMGIDND